jgi:hypothetical protein
MWSWISFLVFAALCSLSVVGLVFFWSSAQLLDATNGKKASTPSWRLWLQQWRSATSASRQLKAKWALGQLRLIGPKLVVLLAVFYSGYLVGHHQGYRQVRADYAADIKAWKERTDKYLKAYAAWETRERSSNRQGE